MDLVWFGFPLVTFLCSWSHASWLRTLLVCLRWTGSSTQLLSISSCLCPQQHTPCFMSHNLSQFPPLTSELKGVWRCSYTSKGSIAVDSACSLVGHLRGDRLEETCGPRLTVNGRLDRKSLIYMHKELLRPRSRSLVTSLSGTIVLNAEL